MDSPSTPGHADPAAEAATAKPADSLGARRATAPSADPAAPSPATETGPVAVERLWADLQTLRKALELLIRVRLDQAVLSLRRAFFFGLAVGVAIFAAAILAATACVMLVVGIAGGVGELVGGRLWLGQLLTGIGLVISGGLLGFLLYRVAQKRYRRKTRERYGKVER